MLKAYNRLHEAFKRLIILGHLIWWAYYTNEILKTSLLDWREVLFSYLGPPVATLILLNIFFLIQNRKK